MEQFALRDVLNQQMIASVLWNVAQLFYDLRIFLLLILPRVLNCTLVLPSLPQDREVVELRSV